MELLGLFVLLEQRPIQLESRCQMVQGLLIVLIVQVCLSQLGVSSYQDEEVLAMDVDQDLAHR